MEEKREQPSEHPIQVESRRKSVLPKAIKLEEFARLMKHTKMQSAKVAFLLAFGSGLRISEIVSLQANDIDEQAKKIMVRQGKYSKDRIVPLPKGWKSEMMKQIPIHKTIRSLQRNFKTASRKAGIDSRYTFHSLRHGFATRAIEAGVPINQVQILLGHSNVSTTNVYIRANPLDALHSYEELF